MASSAAAALLDELMGRTRNCDPNERPSELNWKDDTVCKYFLCGFCPHELFTNTRADLGLCNKIHDEGLRKQYQESTRFEKEGYEEVFLHFLQNMISDVEKRIRRGHQRLALNNNQSVNLNGGLPSIKEEKVNMLTEKINELISQAEELGGEGKVEEAQGVMKLCDQLREERVQIQNEVQQAVPEEGPQVKQMEVCEVCGAFLIVGDAPQRQDEHLMGKQHAGYAQVRAEIEKIKMAKKAVLEEKEQKRQQEREERDRAVEREREERRRREKEREDRERRERDKGRDREQRKHRSRSRSRGHRSRSKERRRSGSRERRRDRDRRRQSRSRSSDRKSSSKSSRRSRSRDKEGSSSRRDRDHKRDRERSYSKGKDQGGDKRPSSDRDPEGWGPGRGHSPDEGGTRSEGDTKKD